MHRVAQKPKVRSIGHVNVMQEEAKHANKLEATRDDDVDADVCSFVYGRYTGVRHVLSPSLSLNPTVEDVLVKNHTVN